MTSRHLVDPQLLQALDALPLAEVTGETLPEQRRGLVNLRVPAPPAPDTTVEERFISGPKGSSVRVLIYVPRVTRRQGALLWIHAGGMVMGVPEFDEAPNRYLADRIGCVVVAVQYRLAPEYPYPNGFEDCLTALRWLHAAANELHFPRKRIAVAGQSGGGCLAAGLSLFARDRGEPHISAQFLLYPMLDDRTGTAADRDPMPSNGEFVWTRNSNHFAWASVLGQEPGGEEVPVYAAPGRALNLTGLPPAFICVGSLDLFLGENLRFARSLMMGGVPTELHVYAGAYHAFTSFSPEADISKRALQEFWSAIERHFR